MFDDDSDVLEKTMKVTVPSLPKENGVLVKINVIELRSQVNLFLAKMIVLDFTGVCYQIVLPVKKLKRLSQKVQEIREFGWKGGCTNLLFHQNSSLSEMHFMVT